MSFSEPTAEQIAKHKAIVTPFKILQETLVKHGICQEDWKKNSVASLYEQVIADIYAVPHLPNNPAEVTVVNTNSNPVITRMHTPYNA